MTFATATLNLLFGSVVVFAFVCLVASLSKSYWHCHHDHDHHHVFSVGSHTDRLKQRLHWNSSISINGNGNEKVLSVRFAVELFVERR